MSSNDIQGSAIERLGIRIANSVERWMPSPFLFAILLTYLVFFAALALGELGIIEQAEGGTAGPLGLVDHWFDGFWDFLAFAMQMTVILMTGFALAYHPRANAILVRLADIPSTPPQAVVFVAIFSMAIAWIHWGFSLILGAIFAREMGKVAYEKGIDVHYPLLAVSGYMGLGLTWHWGLSGSGPLLLTDAASVGEGTVFDMLPDDGIPITETIAHGYGITLTILSIIFASLVLYLITPSGEQARGITEYIPESELFGQETDGGEEIEHSDNEKKTPAERIDNSLVLGGIIGLTGFVYVFYMLVTDGLAAWDLNVINFGFLMAGVLVWTNPSAYRDKFGEAATAAAGIILLFPFFAGIQGIMAGSGLATYIAEVLIDASTAQTFPIIAWVTAAITNAFIPSGGGQWLVLGPPLMEAADGLGVEFGHAAMAYAVGDAHTNLLNPFWAIPLLAITRIKAREMFGYAIVMLLALIPFLAIMLFFLPYEALAIF
ncbi:short-chain fatty acid transporter [Natronorubrum bangense]|uniref:Short-chain fatty acid transporter n=2 Tax=Natronorubrum bangense TaxID=61858 RepID=A0A4D6HS13_9EURY|nr:TIGR00366 family protein [Natronorubrum bangense]QCC56540.1 short-chain fatty acid transporter [Natronorubrum bangense]